MEGAVERAVFGGWGGGGIAMGGGIGLAIVVKALPGSNVNQSQGRVVGGGRRVSNHPTIGQQPSG
jgi:hypothetical protein